MRRGCGARWPEGYSWLVGFSSILHRYECRSRNRDAERCTSICAGVENEVRETTIYGEAGVELHPRVEASFGARVTPIPTLSGSGEHLSPLVPCAGSMTKMPSGKEQQLPAIRFPAGAAGRRPDPLCPLPAGLPARRTVDRQRHGPSLSQRSTGHGGSGVPLRPPRHAIVSTCRAAPRSATGRISRRISSIHPACRSPTISATGGFGRSPSTAASG